jgi:hypothetical protein
VVLPALDILDGTRAIDRGKQRRTKQHSFLEMREKTSRELVRNLKVRLIPALMYVALQTTQTLSSLRRISVALQGVLVPAQ